MDTKLTLKLDEGVIEKAKEYAKANKISLSDLIENYLQKLTDEESGKKKITQLVKSLSGVVRLPKDFKEKSEYTEYLTNKYK